jgi:hypothetical protein
MQKVHREILSNTDTVKKFEMYIIKGFHQDTMLQNILKNNNRLLNFKTCKFKLKNNNRIKFCFDHLNLEI